MKLYVVMAMREGEPAAGFVATEQMIQAEGRSWGAGWQEEVYRLDFTTRRLIKVHIQDYTNVNYRVVEELETTATTMHDDQPVRAWALVGGDDTPPEDRVYGSGPAPTTEQRPVFNNFFKPSDGADG